MKKDYFFGKNCGQLVLDIAVAWFQTSWIAAYIFDLFSYPNSYCVYWWLIFWCHSHKNADKQHWLTMLTCSGIAHIKSLFGKEWFGELVLMFNLISICLKVCEKVISTMWRSLWLLISAVSGETSLLSTLSKHDLYPQRWMKWDFKCYKSKNRKDKRMWMRYIFLQLLWESNHD